MYCFYSYGLASAANLTYARADFSDLPRVGYVDGDVTVPYPSLALCRGWASQQAQPVHAVSYYGLVHATLTSSADALGDIVGAIAAAQAQSQARAGVLPAEAGVAGQAGPTL